nr:TetR/AcrR family transcriptional regulator [Fredinandcohnia onubensis]
MTETSKRILQAALELMQERGFKSVTIKDIALTSGVSEMTVFRQFKTKKGVLEAAVENYSYIPRFEKIFDSEIVWDLEIDLELIANSYISLMKKNEPIFLISIQERNTMPELLDLISKNTLQLKDYLTEYFKVMQEKNKMVESNAEEQAMIFLITLYGFFSTTAINKNHFLNDWNDSFIKTSIHNFCFGLKK